MSPRAEIAGFSRLEGASRLNAGEWAGTIGVFGILPLVVGLWVPPAAWLAVLWLAAVWAAWRLRRSDKGAVAPAPVTSRDVRRIAWRFGLATALLGGAIALWAPERLLAWPRERPQLWLAMLVLYPLLSVWPQEVLYRRFFFRRCEGLLGTARGCVLANAVAFGAMHGIFRNGVAVALSLVAGWIFADTYRRTRSLRLVCVEHSCYGLMAFTLGLGIISRTGPWRGEASS